MTTVEGQAPTLDEAAATAGAVRRAVRQVVVGKDEVVDLALVALLAEGHLLVEDVPGVGKTLLAKALARSIDCSVRRIQFTPDLLPSDVTGVSIWNQERGDFEFRPGAVFANVVIGDEINRASPKTQSALLASMEEQQVTVDGTTYPLPPPFLVVATQNPVEMDGTYPLPEAQRDRFMVRVAMGYPRPEDELRLLGSHVGDDPLLAMTPVADAESVRRAIRAVRGVHVSDALRRYVLDLTHATRVHPDLRLGASPRAGLQLVRAGRALAALSARDHVLPDDVKALAGSVLAHRLLPSARGRTTRKDPLTVVSEIVAATPVPGARG